MIFKQIVRFGIVGIIATIVDFGLLFFLTDILNIHYLISSTISFSTSLIINYYLSIKWVFDVKKRQTFKQVFLFCFLSVVGLIINDIILYVGVNFFSIYYLLCKIISTIIVMIYNFVTRKMIIE